MTEFQNLKIIWTTGSDLASPDILSRNVTLVGYQKHQLRHEKILWDIEFFDENGNSVIYKIQHEDNPHETCLTSSQYIANKGVMEKYLDYKTTVRVIR